MKSSIVSAFTAAALLAGTAVSATAQTAVTDILPSETLTDVVTHNLPTPPVHPAKYTLPMTIKVVKDASITTSTPITDSRGTDYKAWGEMVSECLKSKPMLVRVVGSKNVKFIVNKSEGKLKLNASDKPVCSL